MALQSTLPARHMSRADCEALFRRIVALRPDGDTAVTITSSWRGTTRWARNAITTSTDRTDHEVTITRIIRGARASVTTNQLADASLEVAVAYAERQLRKQAERPDNDFVSGPRSHSNPDIFKRGTYDLLARDRSAVARSLVAPAAAKDVLTAGYIEVRADTLGVFDTKGLASYYAATDAQYSVTARNRSGNGSGWAGKSGSDWAALDPVTLSARALEKCITSANPVAVEPGRYVAILEPQAVHDLMRLAFRESVMNRIDNESEENMPYNLRPLPEEEGGYGIAKFGMQVLDPRITVMTDPMDPDVGYLPFDREGAPFRKVTWVEDGVLRELAYPLDYAIQTLGESMAQSYAPVYRMSGGGIALDEMITTTARGILVTRFTSVNVLHGKSVTTTGITSDGTWLVERGRVAKAVKNFRFNASPLLAFSEVEQLGIPQRVFSPGAPAMVPAMKVRDFNFSSLADAI